MTVLIINSAEPSERGFVEAIRNALVGLSVESVIEEYAEFIDAQDIKACDAVIISASPKGDNGNFKERLKSFQWLKKTKIPVLGICAGHQFIGAIFGGALISDAQSEDGITSVKIETPDPLFQESSRLITVEQHHNDAIALPEEFTLLASSSRCGVQAMRHQTKPIYSVQWHAERSNPDIIRNFMNIVQRMLIDKGEIVLDSIARVCDTKNAKFIRHNDA